MRCRAGQLLELGDGHEIRRGSGWCRDAADEWAERRGDHQRAAEVALPRLQPGILQQPHAERRSMAATAMSVIHIEMHVPTVRKPSSNPIGAGADGSRIM